MPYAILGLALWTSVLKSGVHATLAGVMLGMTIPLTTARSADKGPLEELEDALHPWVAYGILPLFAFAEARDEGGEATPTALPRMPKTWDMM